MNKKTLITVVLISTVVLGYMFYSLKLSNYTQLEYKNIEYGFTFSLPSSWNGYSVLYTKWEGTLLDSVSSKKITGPKILIRNKLWTAEKPFQDIPIMIFTPAQWTLVQNEKISLGAAPIGPSELGRNSKYIFALPARYNYAFPTGYEEVNWIIDSKPLHI